jgi:hypothetical protein
MKKTFQIAVIVLLCTSHVQGQEVIPPSPNAASLGQYGDVSVSNNTGVPSISIPLYTVKSVGIELPISLSYHGSGIKVAQEASWVGLGWALNTGGVITRAVRGSDDLKLYGYLTVPELPSLPSNIPDFTDPDYDFYDQKPSNPRLQRGFMSRTFLPVGQTGAISIYGYCTTNSSI